MKVDVTRVLPLSIYASLKGEQVAARITADDAEYDEWIVVKVINFDRETKEVEVFDEEPGDDEEIGGQRTYKLPMSCILPFPKRTDLSNTQEFLPRKQVLAVYPGTTALYKAVVISTPRKYDHIRYLLEFDDDEEDGTLPQRTVPFHYVVAVLHAPSNNPQNNLESKFSRVGDNYRSIKDEVASTLPHAGLESSYLIVGIDVTKSNK
ncbi:hypothetical protein YC2023_019731 [Brassica napus]